MANKDRLPVGATITDMARGNSQRRRLNPDELRARMHASLNVDNPPDNSARLSDERECQVQLRITDIDPYDRNPRRSRNELFAEIKESIRVARVISPLTVTKRPGSNRYMVAAGGNTRLQAQRELWDETGDPRFEYLLVTYRPWVSEAHVLTAHLVENELHASMTFWDKAQGVWDLKLELESSTGRVLSLRQLNEAMRQQGLSVSVTMLSYYGFALENLSDLGPETHRLSSYAVRDLQKPFGFLCSFIQAYGHSEDDWRGIRRGVLEQFAAQVATATADSPQHAIDVSELIDSLDHAVSGFLGHTSPNRLREFRNLLETIPNATIKDLVQREHETGEVTLSQSDQVVSAALPESGTGEARAHASATTSPPASAPVAPRRSNQAASTAKPATNPGESPGERAAGDQRPAPLAAVQQRVSAFAEACGVQDLLVLNAGMPCGYYLEAPADDKPIDADATSLRYGAWWIAAMHSDQIDGSYSERMPTDSRWRQAQRLEGAPESPPLEWLLEAVLGSPIGLVELNLWLTRCPSDVFELYHDLMRSIRRLRTEAPERFMLDSSESEDA